MHDERPPAGDSGRLPSIDILRGIAIMWVVLFHIWGDIKFFPGAPKNYYQSLIDQARDGAGAWRVFTAFTDVIFRIGFEGVPLFMMISGLSLTVAAYRAGGSLNWPRFFVQRFRKLLLPYWAGVAMTFGVIALIAWRQLQLEGGTFNDHFTGGVTISMLTPVTIDRGVVFASIALVPRLLDDRWFFAPQLALWFVGLLAQYYLLFPLLFIIMKRIGVIAFLLLTFAITAGSNWWALDQYAILELRFRLVTGWAPFRLIEFTAGMAMGWLLVAPEAERWLRLARRWFVVVPVLVLGLVAHTAGDLMIGNWSLGSWQALALPLATAGLALLALPLVVKRPGRLTLSVPARAIATVGVMSYGILIMSDAMRLVASQIRVEQPPDAVWWTFLVAVYVPASVILAWPLCRVFGLMPLPARRAAEPATRPVAAPVPAPVLRPAPLAVASVAAPAPVAAAMDGGHRGPAETRLAGGYRRSRTAMLRTIVSATLISSDVIRGKANLKLPRSRKMSPGSRPAPRRATAHTERPAIRISVPEMIRARAVESIPSILASPRGGRASPGRHNARR